MLSHNVEYPPGCRVSQGNTFLTKKMLLLVFGSHLDPRSLIQKIFFYNEWKWSQLMPTFGIFEIFTSANFLNLVKSKIWDLENFQNIFLLDFQAILRGNFFRLQQKSFNFRQSTGGRW